MNADKLIELINGEIIKIISGFIELKKSGANYTANCPFHNDKTPSLSVSETKGIFKCFGCGKGGNAIEFIKQYEGVGFKKAVEIGAKKLDISFQWNQSPGFNMEQYKHKESMYIACNLVEQFFIQNLTLPDAVKYIKKRNFTGTANVSFGLGFAPGGNALLEYARKNGIKTEILEEIGVLKSNDKGIYDFFRNRIIFPVANAMGQTIAFAGRDLNNTSKAKYLNTHESCIYSKGKELYALNLARSAIKREDRAYITEGYPDVLRMHQIGVSNTICTGGTSLSLEQAKKLKHYTNKVTIIYDADKAGSMAMDRNAEILIKNNFHVSVMFLPEGHDPDSFFTSKEIFLKHIEQQADYILYKSNQMAEKASFDPLYKSEAIKKIAKLISYYDRTKQEIYIEFAAEKIKPKKAWQDALKELAGEQPKSTNHDHIPKEVSLNEFNRWGFYVDNNSYVFRNKKGDDFVTHSNFVMSPLFHIESTINAKRLYEVKNRYNRCRIIELAQKDLVSITSFKLQIESLGNFLWTGGEIELNRLKAWLYEKTKSCKEITQMGWQKQGFYCWGNGIHDGEKFIQADKYGMVQFKDQYYYIPACSEIYKDEDSLFEFERSFIHVEGNISLYEYAQKYAAVFGDNGIVSLSFYFASLFMDIIAKRFDKFPLLNLYGQKGTGKNSCAESLLYLFGNKAKAPNLHNSSKPSIADHVANSANAVCVLDEYRNDLEMEKRELVKGFWDKIGRARMNMDKDKKKEISRVNQGIVLCGQQIATADISLFSRFLAVGFFKTIFSHEEKQLFVELEKINKQGLAQITDLLLRNRENFKKHYNKTVDEINEMFREYLGNREVETRIFNNWLTIASAYATIHKIVELPFKLNETIKMFVSLMENQNEKMEQSDDLAQFWDKVQYLINSNMLFEGGDYKVVYTNEINRVYKEKSEWKKEEKILDKKQHLLYLSVSRVFGLYKTQTLNEGERPLSNSTINYYLKNSPAFICDAKKVSFKKIDPKTGYQECDEKGNKKFTSTSALVFRLDKLNLDIETGE